VVRKPTLLAAVAVVAAAVVVALAVAEDWWGESSTASPREAISAQASISPSAVHFGDVLGAHAVVVVDPRRVDPASVRLAPQFLSYRVADSSRDVRRAGGATTIDLAYDLECLGAGCAPGRPQVVLQFPSSSLRYRTVGGEERRLRLTWPTITVASRLDDEDRAAPAAHLRADATPPAVSYDVSPGLLGDGLVAGSAVLVLAAGALLFFAFRRRPAPAAAPAARVSASPLEDAVRLVRETAANGHDPGLQRMALQRLVRELRAAGKPGLADDAGRLAWSDGPPSPAVANELADRVERQVSGA
jgi:hypothetical protein